MACNNQNTGLMTELVYKVKKLACEVKSLHLEDKSLQEQIDKLAVLIGAEGLAGYDTIMETFNNINDKLAELIDLSTTLKFDPELDADKYLYNDGTRAFWKDVPEVDLSPVYELIYNYHPFDFSVALKAKGNTTFETGSVVNPTLVWHTSTPADTLTITDGTNIKSPEKNVDGKYNVDGEITFDGNYTKTTTFKVDATGTDLSKEDGKTLSDNSQVIITIKDYVYYVRYKTTEYIDTLDKFTNIFNWNSGMEIIGSSSEAKAFTYTPGTTGAKYQYFVLMPVSYKKSNLQVTFTAPEEMNKLGSKKMQNKLKADVDYVVFTTNNLVDDLSKNKLTIQ